MAIRDKYGRTASPTYVGWKPKPWQKDGHATWHSNGRTAPPGPRHTKSPAALRRKARSLAGRKR